MTQRQPQSQEMLTLAERGGRRFRCLQSGGMLADYGPLFSKGKVGLPVAADTVAIAVADDDEPIDAFENFIPAPVDGNRECSMDQNGSTSRALRRATPPYWSFARPA